MPERPFAGQCASNRTFLQQLDNEFVHADLHFLQESDPDYSEYSVVDEDNSLEPLSLARFYDTVAAQSYLLSFAGVERSIVVRRGAQTITVANARTYNPATSELVMARSLLDFVADHLLRGLSSYYLMLFERLTIDDEWHAQSIRSSSLRQTSTIVPVSDDTAQQNAIANLFCQSVNNQVRYGDLLTHDKQVFVQNHLAFFCSFKTGGGIALLDATEIFKTDNTFPLTLTLVSIANVDNDISSELTTLAQLTIDQNATLTDIKALTGRDYYQQRIHQLQVDIAAAQQRAQGPTLFGIIQSIATGAASVSGLSSIVNGAVSLTNLLSGIPQAGTVQYIVGHRKDFAGAADELSKGAAAAGTLGRAVDALIPNQNAAAELAALRAQLSGVQREFEDLLRDIAAASSLQQQQYLTSLLHLLDLSAQRRRTFLTQQASLNKAVVREILGEKLAHANAEAVRVCQLSAKGFLEDPNVASLASLNENCAKYSERVQTFVSCEVNSHNDSGYSLLFGGSTGLLVARDRRQTNCF